jgi:uncharacterized damage-inducible protein DinB
MSELAISIARDLSRYYQERADRIVELVQPLSREQVWRRPYPYGNSIGHLLLHLTGNLNYYIGTEIAGTGYVRNRPLEFSDAVQHPPEALLKDFAGAIAMVGATLAAQGEGGWSTAYAAKGMEQAGDRFYAFVSCAAHLAHHTGQIIYLIKEIQTDEADVPKEPNVSTKS